MTVGQHFETAQFDAFLDDQLSPNERDGLTAHLSNCSMCRTLLESAAGTLQWWAEARSTLADRHSNAVSLFSEQFPSDKPVGDHLGRQLEQILAPSDDPRMLGRIGTYEVVGVIGRGGMGIVLKAFDPSLDRFVAIKVLAPELSIVGAARERFAREARAAAAVTHENVIPIHAVSQFMGHNYIVMQYVPGCSLEQRLRQQGPLDVNEILRIAIHIARALSAAHQHGLVHRDIKPANILLEGGIDRPMVTDFGLARVSSDASLTNSGVVSGTPNYMSPEQAGSEHVDAKSDLFSLGSVMYAMSVGHPPFRSDSVLGVLRRVADDEPTSIRSQNPAVPEWLEAFVLRLLAKKPSDRFDSAEDVAQLLSDELAYQQNPTAHVEPIRSWIRDTKRSIANRTVLAALGLTMSMLGIVWTLWVFVVDSGVASPGRQSEMGPLPSMNLDEWDNELLRAKELSEKLEEIPPAKTSPTLSDEWTGEADRVELLLEELEADDEWPPQINSA